MASQQSFSLRWNDYSSHIARAFESLRYEEDLVDVTLYCEGRRIRAHKMVLSACSSYFKDIFKENPSQHPIIIFKNVKYSDLVSLVEFMYQGEVVVLQESLPTFLHTAELLSVRGLADTCDSIEQHLHNTMSDQPTSSLAQHILQTQSRNMNNATITTEPVYFTLPSNSTIVPQIKIEPQTTASQQLINKILLKSSNDLTTSLGNSIVAQAQQQQTHTQTHLQPQPSTTITQQQTQLQTTIREQQQPTLLLKSSQDSITVPSLGQPITSHVAASQPDQNKQSAAALQDLVDSVISTPRPVKIERVAKPKDAPTTNKQGTSAATVEIKASTSYTSLETTNTPNQPNNGLEMYGQVSQNHDTTTYTTNTGNGEVKLHISEFINVGEGMAATSGESGTFAHPETFELVNENIPTRSDSDENIESSSFEMEIVDMDVTGIFPDEGTSVKESPTDDGTTKTQDKKYKCKVCGRGFVTCKSLNMHLHIHSGRTKCGICGAVLSRTANLKRHMKLKHEP
uniref:BTB domain-containing protein n=1 Tax=Anopheles christyi TaxID=43041 RepID=A0A182JSM2_9DIPT